MRLAKVFSLGVIQYMPSVCIAKSAVSEKSIWKGDFWDIKSIAVRHILLEPRHLFLNFAKAASIPWLNCGSLAGAFVKGSSDFEVVSLA